LIRIGDCSGGVRNVWVGADGTEISVDLMRYTSVAPPGVMEFLLIELNALGKENGYQRFNLGMAPLSGIENRSLAPLWNRVGALLFSRGEPFYNFQVLDCTRRSLIRYGNRDTSHRRAELVLPRILTNVASLISGGLAEWCQSGSVALIVLVRRVHARALGVHPTRSELQREPPLLLSALE